MSETRRRYVYGILVAAAAVALFYGWIDAPAIPLWLTLAVAVLGLGNGLAFANTTRPKAVGRHEREPDGPAH